MAIQPKSKVGRNEKCPCGSGLKFKHCHGDEMKQAVCNRVANEKMVQLILAEQVKRGIRKLKYICNNCNKQFDEAAQSEIVTQPGVANLICPYCDSVNIEENK